MTGLPGGPWRASVAETDGDAHSLAISISFSLFLPLSNIYFSLSSFSSLFLSLFLSVYVCLSISLTFSLPSASPTPLLSLPAVVGISNCMRLDEKLQMNNAKAT